jgi:AcrR family transcriptional regulator
VTARLTRAEQQELTHAKLIDAGRSVFLRRGFLAATAEEIAEAAGYTRGALYKHFGGKEGLWQAIMQERAELLLAGLRTALEAVRTRRQLIAVLDPSAIVRDDEAARWTVAGTEYLVAVAKHPEYGTALARLQRRHDEAFGALLKRHCERLGIRPALPVPDLVTALVALGGGLALICAVDPAVDVTGVVGRLLGVVLPA